MQSMISQLCNFVRDESGATAIEYGLIAALVSVAAIGALRSLGTSLANLFAVVDNALVVAVAPESPPPPAAPSGCSLKQQLAGLC